MTREAPPAPPPIPDYELLREIGRGSYGVVWLARGVTGLYRAVKIVWRAAFEDPQPYEREFRGIKEFAAVSLVEPRQLALLHVGRNDEIGFFYYVMELADDADSGREIDPQKYVPYTLRELRERRGRLPADETLALAVDLASALAGLHAHRLVHRDIKPSNVIFVGGVPKLADIGLVTSAATTDVTVSRVGNPGYMPPDMPGTPSADVYGLGKVLYELATGRNRDDYPRLPADLETLKDRKALLELNEIFTRACAQNPEKRYAQAGVMRDDLLLLQAGKSVRRLRATEKHLARALRSAAVLAVLAALAAGGAWIERTLRKSETDRRQAAEAALADLARKTYYSASLARAQRAIEIGNLGTARKILKTIIPRPGEDDLRHFEWFALWNEAYGDNAEILRESGPPIDRTYVSDDGQLLATKDADDRVIIWSVATNKPLSSIDGIRQLAGFTTDGAWLLGSNIASARQRWSVATGEPDLPGPAGDHHIVGRVHADTVLSFLVDGRRSVTGVELWNARTGNVRTHSVRTDHHLKRWEYGTANAVSRHGRLAVSEWETKPGQHIWRLQCLDAVTLNGQWSQDYTSEISDVAFSQDGNAVAIGLVGTNEVELRDAATGSLRWTRAVEANGIRRLAFSPDGKVLAIGGPDQTVHLLAASTGQSRNRLHGQDGSVTALAWVASNEMVSGGGGGDLRRWPSVTDSSRLRTIQLEPAPRKFRFVCLSDDGTRFAALHGPNRVAAGAARAGERLDIVALPTNAPLAFEKGGAELLTLSADGIVHRWTVDEPDRPTIELQLPLDTDARIICGSLSRDGNRLVAKDSSGTIQFWDFRHRRGLGRVPTKDHLYGTTAISPGGEWAVSWTNNQATRLWAVNTASVVAEWPAQAFAIRAVFASARPWLALCFNDGGIEIRDTTTLALVRYWKTDSPRLEAVAFSHDDRRLFCGGANGIIHVYDTGDWREVATLPFVIQQKTSNPTVTCLAMSTDGSALAAYRQDGILRVWQSRR